MTDMDHVIGGVTGVQVIATLRDAVDHIDVVQPEHLRAPLVLWFRATEEQAIRDRWDNLWGRPVVAVWNAARAVVDAAGE